MAKLKKSPTKEARKATVEVMSSRKTGSGAGDERVIEAAKGKLGVMIPGMGAVATTFVAGVEAVRTALNRAYGIRRGLPFWKARHHANAYVSVSRQPTLSPKSVRKNHPRA